MTNDECRMTKEGNKAFTLIELLVVIAIIVILIGLLFPAFRGVQDQAKKAQAKNDLVQIVTAVNAFYTEYGRYPVSSTITTDAYFGSGTAPSGTTAGGTNDALCNELRVTGTYSINTRQIVFMSPPNVKDGSNPKSGIGTTTSTGQYFDPWGSPYNVTIDTNYDNQLTNPYTADTGAGPATLRQGVIAWSIGKDATQGTTNFKASDDVISWQ